ncbi:MAG: hypothetical protein A2268_08780 [Candidatus Raymondbacteria bacterium RifOxyA12_full_50_37]|uniref:DUF4398 domain-containing protein n=1 Tax=Candidatus Raymondbacteria bacterium RIFOXYD12_FULL_49_13 TaxID=1817890 RepID=A0A1F7FGJ6_UNCRA|nr:MAG: hypothetical protein A2350_19700 [Candidatus Raymondbacteria bacterium RifOxyB12_full_50_8]OGJ91587.1 MAG: hypothetical protein A2268_08780 [Candidatus Raymondbacteria bacterium RifOxyA12_full_50_37]OGJ92893.1 MAG: hypothetical protein A2248_08480 [Candidatus Raymondbacteria bacterium RIFOXYA2_FULL_49_16]OGJ94820.1 MAG: hypothetical protein A2487_03180 [Candidatus Raymondbacteria bacterium RifOxyC12_full_50_8]OGK05721.1 MAG: hypothetical protein A2519_03990 [Candidatus Raymondbacteria b
MRFTNAIVAAGVAAALMSGCAKAPDQDVEKAKKAVETAQAGEAGKYAPVEFSAASDAIKAALAEIEKQKAKFVLGRNYEAAKKSLASAMQSAEAALTAAAANKEAMKAEVAALIKKQEAKIAEAKAALNKVSKNKKMKDAAEKLESAVNDLENGLASLKASFENGEIASVKEQIVAAVGRAESLIKEMAEPAKAAKTEKPKKKK